MDIAPPEGFAFSCDDQGNILRIISGHIDFFNLGLELGNFLELGDNKARVKLKKFFQEIQDKGAALCWELEISCGTKSEILNFFGLVRDGTINVLSSRNPKSIFTLYNDILGCADAQSFLSRSLQQEAQIGDQTQHPGNHYFDEFMKLNNELINTQRELHKQKRRILQQASHDKEALFEHLFEHSPVGSAIVDLDLWIKRVNDELCRITGYTRQELEGRRFSDITPPEDLLVDGELAQQLEAGLIEQYTVDKRYLRKGGGIAWVHVSLRLIRDDNGRPQYYLPMMVDIEERKELERELRSQATILEEKSNETIEVNTALRILLAQREKDRLALHDQVLTNMRLLIVPYLERVYEECPQPSTRRHIEMARRNFEDITSSFARTLGSEYRTLTANEIRVADLIRSGMTSKEISSILSISSRTAEYYRGAIRRKLGLKDRSTNLYAHLNALAKS